MNLTEELLKLGFTLKDIKRITKNNKLIESTLLKKIIDKIDYLLSLGYKYNNIIKMISYLPQIIGLSDYSIKKQINDMIKLEYTYEQVLKMTSEVSKIFSYSINNIETKINDIIKLGYTKEQVLKMTYNLPALFNYSIENIKEKIDLYDSLNLHELFINNTGYLIQSAELSYLRVMFLLKEKSIEINMTNYTSIFKNAKLFENQYKVTTEELLEMYDYEEYLKGSKDERNLQLKLK